MNAVLQRHSRRPDWLTAPVAYRACDLCTHGRDACGERHCTHPSAARPAASRPVHLVRATYGACGPNGTLLHLPGMPAC